MDRTRVGAALALIFVAVGASTAYAAAKTDIVELANGDRMTCEIKKLDRGKLTVKTDGLGTVSIEWDDIQHITSAQRFNVELASGERTVGSLGRGAPRTVDTSRAAAPNASRSATSCASRRSAARCGRGSIRRRQLHRSSQALSLEPNRAAVSPPPRRRGDGRAPDIW